MRMNIYDYAEEKKMSIRRVLDFTLLSNPLGPSNKARSAMRSALRTVALFPDEKTRHLRRYLSRRELVEPENVMFSHGSMLLLEMLFRRMRPARVLIPGPLPTHYAPLLRRHGTSVVSCPLKEEEGYSLDVHRLLPLIDHVDMLLFPNPHWKTGTLIPSTDVRQVAGRLQGSNKVFVLDEGLVEFTGSAFPAGEAIRSESMLVLRTFSFYHALAGLRLGYALGSGRILGLLSGDIDQGPVNAVAVAGAIASLKDKGFQRRTAEFLKTEKAYLMDRLGRIKGVRVMDTPCNFLLVKLKAPTADLDKGFLRRDILIDCFEGNNGSSLIRVPARGRRENGRFVKALGQLLGLQLPGHPHAGTRSPAMSKARPARLNAGNPPSGSGEKIGFSTIEHQ